MSWNDTKQLLVYLLLIVDIVFTYRGRGRTKLTFTDKRIIRKALRFYEDIALGIAGHTTKPEQLADDLKSIDQLKEKIK